MGEALRASPRFGRTPPPNRRTPGAAQNETEPEYQERFEPHNHLVLKRGRGSGLDHLRQFGGIPIREPDAPVRVRVADFAGSGVPCIPKRSFDNWIHTTPTGLFGPGWIVVLPSVFWASQKRLRL
jgi:hypothetical protein